MRNTTLCQNWGFARFFLCGCLFFGLAATARGHFQPRWDALNDVGNLGRVSSIEVSPFDPRKIIAGGDVLGVGLTNDGGHTWLQTYGFANYQDDDVTFHPTDPNIVWIGTLGGPYKSTDGGRNWMLQREGMPPIGSGPITAPIERVIFDPANSNTLLAFAGNHRHMGYGRRGITHWGGVWKSTDGGDHWTLLTTISPDEVGADNQATGAEINDAAFAAGSSSVLYACCDRLGVYKSIDGGSHWQKINRGLPNTKAWSIALHPTNANILWVALGDGGGIYKSTNGGMSWQKSSQGITGITSETTFRTIAVARSDPNYLYCAMWEGGGSAYRSTDGGQNWVLIDDHGSHATIIGGSGNHGGLFFQRINVDPNNARHLVGACEGMVVQSFDAGNTWKDTTSYPTDGGWRGTGYSGMCGTCIAWDPYQPGHVFTLGDDEGKLERSEDYLWSWQLKGSPDLIGPYNGASDVTFAQDGTIYVGSGQFGNHVAPYANEPIIKSIDGGANWFYVKRPPGAIGDNRAVYVNPKDSRQVWCIVGPNSGGTLYTSRDGGTTWSTLNLGNSGSLWNIVADPRNPTTLYIGSQSGIWTSTDGINFSLMRGSPVSENFEYVSLDPVDPDTVYGISFNSRSLGGLYRYRDRIWTRLLAKPQARVVAVDPGNPRRIALATQGWTAFDKSAGDGIWLSEDDGLTWRQCNAGLRMWDGPALAFNPDKSGQLIYATDGAGFFVTDLGDSQPHGGQVRSILQTIDAADYDDGAQGFAAAGSARGGSIGPLKRGQWVHYSVDVPDDGFYDVDCRMSAQPASKFHLEFNGVNVTGPIAVTASGGWAKVHIPHVQLWAGDQYMKLFAESDGLMVQSLKASKQ
jgi:photosystem II stability/assembly factor-like uncharacterized protein